MKNRILTVLVSLFMLMAPACNSVPDPVSVDRWLARIEITAGNFETLSEREEVREWAGIIREVVSTVREGKLDTVRAMINQVEALKPTVIQLLIEDGVSRESILGIVSALDLALLSIEELLPPEDPQL